MKLSKKTIIYINLATFFITVSTEVYETLLPFILVKYFSASMVIVGLIDGLGEAFSNLIKIFGGYLSDIKDKKKLLSFGLSSLLFSYVYMAFSTKWADALISVLFKSIGEGIFIPVKDKILSTVYKKEMGKIFSLNKIFENLGELIGIFLAFLISLILLNKFGYRYVYFLILGTFVVFTFFLVFFTSIKLDKKVEKKKISWKIFEPSILIFFFLFSFVNFGYSFFILKVYDFLKSESFALGMYLIFGFVLLVSTYFAGRVYDSLNLKNFLYITVVIFILSNLLLIIFPPLGLITLAVGEAFLEIGVWATVGKRVKFRKGFVFGVYHFVIGVSSFISSFVSGYLWDYFSSNAPFLLGTFVAFLSLFYIHKFIRV
ncbi:MFS transporter [Sulfurihydrogenibium subterraneum]|uniref:MFS transporter n=1 Tax=Sulfurihydrogenibium subterraneum TaxID=171121 RepID=UPI00048DC527|nr:MFS transporter [Sulfurihydrogenibium subterraneum]